MQSKAPAGECGDKDQVSGGSTYQIFRGLSRMPQDKTLVCRDCGSEFLFTAGEQEFYAEQGFQNEPIRCKTCRQARKASKSGSPAGQQPRKMYAAVCDQCGAETEVPFQPKSDRPVYCSQCFSSMRK